MASSCTKRSRAEWEFQSAIHLLKGWETLKKLSDAPKVLGQEPVK